MRKRQKKDSAEDEDVPDDGLYRGQKGYRSHIKKNTEIPKAMRIGPQRSSNSTIRTVTIVDYQPDVCKDYKGMSTCPLFCILDLDADLGDLQKLGSVVTVTHVNSYTTEGHVSIPILHFLGGNSTYVYLYVDLAGWQLDKLAANPQRQELDESDSDSDDPPRPQGEGGAPTRLGTKIVHVRRWGQTCPVRLVTASSPVPRLPIPI